MIDSNVSSANLYSYGDAFYSYQRCGSLKSALAVVPILASHLRPSSILDVGCGAGAWCRAWLENGVEDVVGMDGSYVDGRNLLIDAAKFCAGNVGAPFRLGRQFDLVQCLEVAEHLAPSNCETLVDNLVAHAPLVLFSAARPGQGGENHINERPYEHWRDRFLDRDYLLYDLIRPQIVNRPDIEPWYRFNMLLFARRDWASRLPPNVQATQVDRQTTVPDWSPSAYRFRCRLLSSLPSGVVTQLARAKHRAVLASRRKFQR